MDSERKLSVKPSHISKCAYNHWLKASQHSVHTCHSLHGVVDLRKEIDQEMRQMALELQDCTPKERKTLWKSSNRQLRCLFEKYSKEIEKGEGWVTSHVHGNNLLLENEEAILCGLLTGIHRKRVPITLKYVRKLHAWCLTQNMQLSEESGSVDF